MVWIVLLSSQQETVNRELSTAMHPYTQTRFREAAGGNGPLTCSLRDCMSAVTLHCTALFWPLAHGDAGMQPPPRCTTHKNCWVCHVCYLCWLLWVLLTVQCMSFTTQGEALEVAQGGQNKVAYTLRRWNQG